MIKIKYTKLISLLILIILHSSCTKEEIVVGDNKLLSLDLIKNGITYSGVINEDKITFTAPSNIDLTNAEVIYKISEYAQILPRPEDIKDWNNEQAFRIESSDGKISSYITVMNRTYIASEGDVILKTQKDVIDLADKQLDIISGNLIIGEEITKKNEEKDPITSLEFLSNLKIIRGNLVINNSFRGESLEGLENIEELKGLIIKSYQSENTEETKNIIDFKNTLIIELEKLQKIDYIVADTDSLKIISLPKIATIDSIHINSIGLVNINLNSLKTVNENIYIAGFRGNTIDKTNSTLNEINLSSLESAGKNLIIEHFWNLTKLNLSNLNSVNGDLDLKYLRKLDKIQLPSLNTLTQGLRIEANDMMIKLEVPNLISLHSLYIASYNNFSNNLKEINFPKLKKCTENLEISFAGSEALNFESLEDVGIINLFDFLFLKEISFNNLKSCSEILINLLPRLENVNLKSLEKADIIKIKKTTALKSISLSHIKTMSEFYIFEAEELKEITGLEIESIKKFSAKKCSKLEKIDLEKLNTAERVDINSASALFNFIAFKNAIHKMEKKNWKVSKCGYNPSYEDMINGKYTNEK